jgi:3-mercaptopyruvate sulfurtransferase SseA
MLHTVKHARVHLVVSWLILAAGVSSLALANPSDYPEFAQQRVDAAIPIRFIAPPEVKQRLDTSAPTVIVDVRDAMAYDQGHLPGAISIPLTTLPLRMTEIMRDVPVVLY